MKSAGLKGKHLCDRRQQSGRCADLSRRQAARPALAARHRPGHGARHRRASAAISPSGCKCRRRRSTPSSSASTATAWCRSGRAPPSPACRWNNGPASTPTRRRKSSKRPRAPAPRSSSSRAAPASPSACRSAKSFMRSRSIRGAMLPVSSLINGPYGIHDVCLSVPTEVGCGGVRKQIELALTPKERLGLQNSARVLRETIDQVEARLAGAGEDGLPTDPGSAMPAAAWQNQRVPRSDGRGSAGTGVVQPFDDSSGARPCGSALRAKRYSNMKKISRRKTGRASTPIRTAARISSSPTPRTPTWRSGIGAPGRSPERTPARCAIAACRNIASRSSRSSSRASSTSC